MTKVQMEQLGRELAGARVTRRLTQADAARSIGVHRHTIIAIEAGQGGVAWETVVCYAALVGHPLADAVPAAEAPEEAA